MVCLGTELVDRDRCSDADLEGRICSEAEGSASPLAIPSGAPFASIAFDEGKDSSRTAQLLSECRTDALICVIWSLSGSFSSFVVDDDCAGMRKDATSAGLLRERKETLDKVTPRVSAISRRSMEGWIEGE